MNLSRAIFEVGVAVKRFKSHYKNDKSAESIRKSWDYILRNLEDNPPKSELVESPDSAATVKCLHCNNMVYPICKTCLLDQGLPIALPCGENNNESAAIALLAMGILAYEEPNPKEMDKLLYAWYKKAGKWLNEQ